MKGVPFEEHRDAGFRRPSRCLFLGSGFDTFHTNSLYEAILELGYSQPMILVAASLIISVYPGALFFVLRFLLYSVSK